MSAADPFTRASPHYANAMRLRANTGPVLRLSRRRTPALRMILEAFGLGLFLGFLLFGAVCGLALCEML